MSLEQSTVDFWLIGGFVTYFDGMKEDQKYIEEPTHADPYEQTIMPQTEYGICSLFFVPVDSLAAAFVTSWRHDSTDCETSKYSTL